MHAGAPWAAIPREAKSRATHDPTTARLNPLSAMCASTAVRRLSAIQENLTDGGAMRTRLQWLALLALVGAAVFSCTHSAERERRALLSSAVPSDQVATLNKD